jgi:hypothetical protein
LRSASPASRRYICCPNPGVCQSAASKKQSRKPSHLLSHPFQSPPRNNCARAIIYTQHFRRLPCHIKRRRCPLRYPVPLRHTNQRPDQLPSHPIRIKISTLFARLHSFISRRPPTACDTIHYCFTTPTTGVVTLSLLLHSLVCCQRRCAPRPSDIPARLQSLRTEPSCIALHRTSSTASAFVSCYFRPAFTRRPHRSFLTPDASLDTVPTYSLSTPYIPNIGIHYRQGPQISLESSTQLPSNPTRTNQQP